MHRLQTFLLLVIAVSLAIIAFRPIITPAAARADNGSNQNLYVEPGATVLRAPDGSQQVNGKVVIDMDTGKIWGFPTFGAQPYPIDSTRTTPPTSRPIFLGKFDFSAIHP